MTATRVSATSPLAGNVVSASLISAIARDSFWLSKMGSASKDAPYPVQYRDELEKKGAAEVSYDIVMQLSGRPVRGGDVAEGTATALKIATDKMYIDQLRKVVDTGDAMSDQRTVHDLKKLGINALGDYMARLTDEMVGMYVGGRRGTNADFIEPLNYTGHANNPLEEPDAKHIMFPNAAITAASGLTTGDVVTREFIERGLTRVKTQGGGSDGLVRMRPIKTPMGMKFAVLLHPWQVHTLRNTVGEGQWLDITKYASAAQGKDSPLFTGNLGMIKDGVLWEHETVTLGLGGAGNAVKTARALILGRHAAQIAYGRKPTRTDPNGMKYFTVDQEYDFGDKSESLIGTIIGVKKVRYDGNDHGVMALETAVSEV